MEGATQVAPTVAEIPHVPGTTETFKKKGDNKSNMPNQGNSNEQTTTYPRQTEGTRGECIHSCTAGVPTCASVSASSSSARACATSCALLAAWLARECQHLRISLFRRPPRFSQAIRLQFWWSCPCWTIYVDRSRTWSRNKPKEHRGSWRGRPCTP